MAPARIPVVEPHSKGNAQSNAAKWIFGLLVLLIICWGVWQVGLHSFGGNPASQPVQQPVEHKQSTGNVAFTVRAQGTYNYKIMVPAGAFNVTLKGHFAASGGSGNDVEVFVVSQDEFINWQNRHPVKALYSSGKVTQDSINLTLPSDAANYYVVFSNRFSMLTPKAVQASFDLNFYTK